jgi:hypothetical protein
VLDLRPDLRSGGRAATMVFRGMMWPDLAAFGRKWPDFP